MYMPENCKYMYTVHCNTSIALNALTAMNNQVLAEENSVHLDAYNESTQQNTGYFL